MWNQREARHFMHMQRTNSPDNINLESNGRQN
jgi:hypothetical protein